MNNGTFGQSNITNILSISRNDWLFTPRENQLHGMTINCVLETINNTICVETCNQLHLQIVVYSNGQSSTWTDKYWCLIVCLVFDGVHLPQSRVKYAAKRRCCCFFRLCLRSVTPCQMPALPTAWVTHYSIWSNLPSYKVEFRYQSEFPASSVKS